MNEQQRKAYDAACLKLHSLMSLLACEEFKNGDFTENLHAISVLFGIAAGHEEGSTQFWRAVQECKTPLMQVSVDRLQNIERRLNIQQRMLDSAAERNSIQQTIIHRLEAQIARLQSKLSQ